MKKFITVIFRVLCLPFWMCITAIALFYQWLLLGYNYLIYGGESVAYTKKTQKPMIADVFFYAQKQMQNERKD